MKTNNIAGSLDKGLPEIITQIASEYGIAEYAENPDFFDRRMLRWHQYGLLTHTRKVREHFLSDLDGILTNWALYASVESYLSNTVDGIDKRRLLEISTIPHDLGKIICLHSNETNREHEAASISLLDSRFIKDRLTECGLNDKHLGYIRRCVETHDVFGKEIRDKLKRSEKLSLKYSTKEEVRKLCRDLARKYSDTRLEIGIFFICDSLGKLDMRIEAKDDSQIAESEEEVKKYLLFKNLPEELRFGIMQMPVNLSIGRTYLEEATSLK